jgi:hypothetical protein
VRCWRLMVTRSFDTVHARVMGIAFLECINMIVTRFHIILLFFILKLELLVHPNV